jgi:hypothetical protein
MVFFVSYIGVVHFLKFYFGAKISKPLRKKQSEVATVPMHRTMNTGE